MSKMDALRAMREARYAEAVDRAAQAKKTPTTTPKATPKATTRPPVAPPEATAPEQAPDGRCGHRSINGRTCTREAGHAAKSHRYS